MKPPRSSTNKKFLGNILVSTLRSHSRKDSHCHGKRNIRHYRKHIKFDQPKHKDPHFQPPNLIKSGNFRYDDYKKISPSGEKDEGQSSSKEGKDHDHDRWMKTHDKLDKHDELDYCGRHASRHDCHESKYEKYDSQQRKYNSYIHKSKHQKPEDHWSEDRDLSGSESGCRTSKYRKGQRLELDVLSSDEEKLSDRKRKKTEKKSKKKKKNKSFREVNNSGHKISDRKKSRNNSNETEDIDSKQKHKTESLKRQLSCDSEESLLEDIHKHTGIETAENPREKILDIFGEYVIDKQQTKKSKHKSHKSKHKKHKDDKIILDL